MRLCIMRHGIAMDRTVPECPADPERPLTPKGRDRVRRAAEGLRVLGVKPDALWTSPYLRAVQTGEIVAGILGLGSAELHHTDALLPGASPEKLFRELCRDTSEMVLCFGHGPHVDEAIAYALGLPRPITVLKKAGVACLSLDGPYPPHGGQLEWLYPAKVLRLMKG